MIEGSGSISLTNGSGSGRPTNTWILRIRIRNTRCILFARAGELPAGGGGLHPVRRYQAVSGGPARGIHPEPAEAARGSSSGGWRGRPTHPTLLRLHWYQGGQLETLRICRRVTLMIFSNGGGGVFFSWDGRVFCRVVQFCTVRYFFFFH